MLMFNPPERVTTQVHYRLEDKFRKTMRTEWADPNRLGQEVDSFLEGPSFDRAGNLYFVDIPFGRVFRLAPTGSCDLVCRYDGWPNGLKIHRDGRIFIADYKRGLVDLDAATGTVTPISVDPQQRELQGPQRSGVRRRRRLLLHRPGPDRHDDPTGGCSAYGELAFELLLSTTPSPNGLVLNIKENRLFVAVTRQNAAWRARSFPTPRVQGRPPYPMSGGHAGPDGMALDQEDGIYVCHLGTGVWRFDPNGMPTHLIEASEGHI